MTVQVIPARYGRYPARWGKFGWHKGVEIMVGPTGLTLDQFEVLSVDPESQGEQLEIKTGWEIVGIYRVTDGLREEQCEPCLKALPHLPAEGPWSAAENFLVRFRLPKKSDDGYATVSLTYDDPGVGHGNLQLKKVDHPDAAAFWGGYDD